MYLLFFYNCWSKNFNQVYLKSKYISKYKYKSIVLRAQANSPYDSDTYVSTTLKWTLAICVTI